MTDWKLKVREKDISEMSLGFWFPSPDRQAIFSKQRFRNSTFFHLRALPSSIDGFQGHCAHPHQEVGRSMTNGMWAIFIGQAWKWFISLCSSSFGHACEETWKTESSCASRKKSKQVWSLASSLCFSEETRKWVYSLFWEWKCSTAVKNRFLIPRFIFSLTYFSLYPFSSTYFLYLRVHRIFTYSFLMKANYLLNTYLCIQ